MVEKIYEVNFFPSAHQDLALIKRYWESVLETPADEFMAEIYYKGGSDSSYSVQQDGFYEDFVGLNHPKLQNTFNILNQFCM